jgi:singapore isolate B (sub-type 7) whole genome shotgun sequence assembly, scaffold_4
MSRTDLVFGMHGAAFVNIMFMRPRSGFIEFFSPTSQIPYYQNMAKHCDLISEGISKVTADKSRKMPKDHRNLNIIVDLPYAKTVFSSVVAEVKKQKYALVKTNVL